jgi:hypothetical protein
MFEKRVMGMQEKTIDELLDWEDNWLDRDGLDEGEGRHAWLEGSIGDGSTASFSNEVKEGFQFNNLLNPLPDMSAIELPFAINSLILNSITIKMPGVFLLKTRA